MKKLIINQLWLYGFLSMLLVMEILEDEERYELCGEIHNILRQHGSRYDFYIPDRYNEEAVELMKQYMKDNFGFSGDVAERNNSAYAMEILEKIERQEEADQKELFCKTIKDNGGEDAILTNE